MYSSQCSFYKHTEVKVSLLSRKLNLLQATRKKKIHAVIMLALDSSICFSLQPASCFACWLLSTKDETLLTYLKQKNMSFYNLHMVVRCLSGMTASIVLIQAENILTSFGGTLLVFQRVYCRIYACRWTKSGLEIFEKLDNSYYYLYTYSICF